MPRVPRSKPQQCFPNRKECLNDLADARFVQDNNRADKKQHCNYYTSLGAASLTRHRVKEQNFRNFRDAWEKSSSPSRQLFFFYISYPQRPTKLSHRISSQDFVTRFHASPIPRTSRDGFFLLLHSPVQQLVGNYALSSGAAVAVVVVDPENRELLRINYYRLCILM